ncbi:glycosyltransferase BC10-like [Cannabis sativa]|uniref:glycosyltransferase BC10-like n=1 Tax=Cannabis sativa TaxID=3483 RepID=UPI0029CA6E9B|nr:glycosyltransferase BC10-like [Cannabis sativa]
MISSSYIVLYIHYMYTKNIVFSLNATMGNAKEQHKPLPIAKFLSRSTSYGHLSYIFNFSFFLIGLTLGITAVFCFQSFDIMSQISTTSDILLSSNLFALLPPPLPSLPQPPPPPPPTPYNSVFEAINNRESSNFVHDLDDNELLWRASFVSRTREYPNSRVPKVAFMFLTKGNLPFAPIWEIFFKGHKELYSIYVHTHPSFVDSTTQDSVFYKRRIPSKQVHWGKSTMTDAERRLIASALLDLSNERFVLLSEACIPLFNFTNTYNYLINTKLNFVQLFDDPGREGQGRYSSEMSPQISLSNWRKGSQWFASNRKLSVEIVSDSKYYPIFQKYCNPPCYADEHYIPTLINILFPEANSNRSITWVDWSKGGKAHPGTFGKKNVSEEILDKIRFGTNCTYIDSGGNMKSTSLCFLFARKFLPETSQQLLRIAPWYVLLNNTGA